MQNIVRAAKKIFSKASRSHDWEHTRRVCAMALHIGKKEKADRTILLLAAVLHDTGREVEDKSNGKRCHAQQSARIARVLMKKEGIQEDIIRRVVHCIEAHRFRGSKEPLSLEAKVLYDADKLDSIGAVGIGRAFLFAGEVGAKLHNDDIPLSNTKPYSQEDTAYREYMVKLRYIKGRMRTKEGARLARGRHRYMADFFSRLAREIRGTI